MNEVYSAMKTDIRGFSIPVILDRMLPLVESGTLMLIFIE